MDDPEEFHKILTIYDQYPVSELIIHPRVRKDFYRHPVRYESFDNAVSSCKMPVTLNGGIVTITDYQNYAAKYPKLKAIMVGQGMVSDPFLADRIKLGVCSDSALLRCFHDELYFAYAELFQSRNNAVKRMKELWFYLIQLFDGGERLGKCILKSRASDEYETAVSRVFGELVVRNESLGGW